MYIPPGGKGIVGRSCLLFCKLRLIVSFTRRKGNMDTVATPKRASRKKAAAPARDGNAALVPEVSTNKQGQALGRKGFTTRLRLMDATRELLKTTSPVELTAVSIAKAAQTSSATFYMYFDDIKEVLIALAEVAGHDTADVFAVLDETWDTANLTRHADRLVAAFYAVWDKHREVLRYRNIEADRGDPGFDKLRMDVYIPFIELLAQRIIASCPPDDRPSRGDARALASVLHAALERLAATDPDVVSKGLGAVRLKAALARVIVQVVSNACCKDAPLPKG